jgi:cation diffusion facilitator CzcD-associated flavoprotein CzcO
MSTFENKLTGEKFEQESKLIFSATGGLVRPNKCNIPGAETFKGQITHTGAWDNNTEWKDKDVVVVGNGCSATQVIPAIVPDVKSLTQFIRTPQYYFGRVNPRISDNWKWAFQNVPGFLWTCRVLMFMAMEANFPSFYLNEVGAKKREEIKKASQDYVKAVAPEEYWPLLTPSYDVGCKRRIFDPGYLATLKLDNVHMTNDPLAQIKANSVVTKSGKEYKADVLILANGFDTSSQENQVLGRNGMTLKEHWSKYGGVEAYKGVALADFPNMFMIFGPNSGAGHQSAVYAIENEVELVLRMAEPVMKGRAELVEVKDSAEHDYSDKLQAALRERVWNKVCHTYYVDEKTGWNFSLYPYTSYRMWYDCRFPKMSDWIYKV